MRARPWPWLSLLLAGMVIAAAACGDDDGDETSQEPADVTLARAAEAIGKLRSFHFVLSHENGTTPIAFGFDLVRAEGDVVSPDRVRADLRAERGRLTASIKVVAIGKDLWITDPIAGKWQKVGGNLSLRDFLAPDEGVTSLVRNARDPRPAGRETVAGDATQRIAATVASDFIRPLVPVAEPGIDVAVTLWVGDADSLVRRIRVEGPLTRGERSNVQRLLNLSRFDEPFQIAPP